MKRTALLVLLIILLADPFNTVNGMEVSADGQPYLAERNIISIYIDKVRSILRIPAQEADSFLQYLLPISQDNPAPAPNPDSQTAAAAQPWADQAELLKPIPLTEYPADHPAPDVPLLLWTVPLGTVYYEIEFMNEPPENPNDTSPSCYRFYASRAVYTNGYCADLSAYPYNHLYWRVRGLDLDGNPVGVFSDAASLYIDHDLAYTLKPVSNTGYKAANMPMPLYPVYAWIPIPGAAGYEVELTSAPPENPNDIYPSQFAIRSLHTTTIPDCYDEEALSIPGSYYWRVRGLDEFGDPVGVFSVAEEFAVPDPGSGVYAATLGDSITHGGGSISYSPASAAYSYQNYLSFPTLNLGRSADTAETMLNRFEADVLPFQPEFLIIMGGSNSLRGGIPADQVISALAGIRDKCAYYGIRPIFLTLPPINPDAILRAFGEETTPDWQEQFAAVNNFIREQEYCIDIGSQMPVTDGILSPEYSVDGLHLDIEGKKLMAQIINMNWSRVTQ